MERTGTLFGAWLLAAALVTSGVAGGTGPVAGTGLAAGPGPAAEPPAAGEGPAPPLGVRVEPDSQVVDSGAPASYAIVVSNPDGAEPRTAFLTVGASSSGTEPGPRSGTEALSPVSVDGSALLLVEPVALQPGEREYLAVPVPADVEPGEYEVNATVGYFAGGTYRTASDAATLTVESCRSLSGWLGCNSSWLLGLLGLFVAVLSFFGYDRVRGRLRTVDSIDDATDDRS